MGTTALIPVEEYLETSYRPDREYRDGVLVERNVGDEYHANLQTLLTIYIGSRRKEWNIHVYTELRVKVRDKWYPIPDVCIDSRPKFKGRYPETPPLFWIEILSYDDRMTEVWDRAAELVANGVPYVWIIDPRTLWSELRTRDGVQSVPENTLRIPGTPIVIPLADVVAD